MKMNLLLHAMSAVAVVAATASPLSARADYYVSAEFGSDDNAGTSMTRAFKTLDKFCGTSPKVDFAGKTVVVSNGTYVISNAIYSCKSVFKSFSGNCDDVTVDAQHKTPAFYLGSGNDAGELRGITVANGYLRSSSMPTHRTFGGGAGVCMNGGGIVSNCIIRGCQVLCGGSVALNGGGVYCNGGTLVDVKVEGCSVSDISSKTPTGCGGGVWITNVSNFAGCALVGNSAANGGGLGVGTSPAVITNCVISGNSATSGGGVQFAAGLSGVKLACSVIRGNTASTGAGIGFAGNGFADAEVILCAIEDNVATGVGGAIYSSSMHGGRIRDCLVSGNAGVGGAIIYNKSDASKSDPSRPVNWTVLNSLFRKNSDAGRGHAYLIAASGESNVVDHCDFVENTGSAVFSACSQWGTADSGVALRVSACVVCGNTTNFTVDAGDLIPNVRYTYSTGIPATGQDNIIASGSGHPIYQFRDYPAGDWRLKPSSALLNHDSSSAYPTDWTEGATDLGNGTYSLEQVGRFGRHLAFRYVKPRKVGDCPDIGCFESRVAKGFFVGFD